MSDGVDESYVIEPDHFARAKEDLPSPYHQPRILALLEAHCSEIQRVEEDIADLVFSGIDNSNGYLLDQWGALFDEERGDLLDYEYQRFIKARIRIDFTDSTSDDLIEIYHTITDAVYVHQWDNYPAATTLVSWRASFMRDELARRVVRSMKRAIAAGVGYRFVEAIIDESWASDEEPLDYTTLARRLDP